MLRQESVTDLNLIDKVTIVNQREGGFVEAFVPISLIYREDVPVDDVHVSELAESMRQEAKGGLRMGQLSPALLAQLPHFQQLPIIDGFHRVAALDLNDEREIFSTIRPSTGWEEVMDLRILAAATHRTIRFARLIEWVNEAWHTSPWSDQIMVTQAFALRYSSAITGERMGLSLEDVGKIRNWVDRKCEQWHMKPGSLYPHLLTAQSAAPDLVKEARERRGGSALGSLTPHHLKEISLTLPYKFDLQRIVARAAKEHTLTVRMTRALSVAVARASDTDEVQSIIDSENWKLFESSSIIRNRLPRVPEQKIDPLIELDLVEKFFQAELKIAELTIENAQLTGRYTPYERLAYPAKGNTVPKDEVEETTIKVAIEPEELTPQIKLNDAQIDSVITQIYAVQSKVQQYLHNRFGVSRDEGDDIISEVILKTLAAIKKGRFEFKGEVELVGWAMKVARNTVVDKHRKMKGARIQSMEEPGTKDPRTIRDQLADEGIDNDFQQAEQEYQQIVKRCLPFLQEVQRRVFILRTFFHLPHVDIAQIIGTTSGATRMRLFDAKEKIASLIVAGRVL